jgi:hypothetical protein
MIILPPEIVCNILDHLTDDTKHTLLACALVCRDWHRLSLPKIWQQPHLGSDHSIDKLLQVAQESSFPLLSYIQRLHLFQRISIHVACKLLPLCPNLSELTLTWYFELTDVQKLSSILCALDKLIHLHLHRCYFHCSPMELLKPLAQSSQLQKLEMDCIDIHPTFRSNIESLPPMSFSNLRSIRLSEAMSLTDSFLIALFPIILSEPSHSFPLQLTSIQVDWCSSLTDWSLARLCSQCPHLQHLDARGTKIGNDTLIALSESCLLLTTLIIGTKECSYRRSDWGCVSNQGIIAIAHTARHLRHVALDGCVRVDDEAVLALLENSPVRRLDLGYTHTTDRWCREVVLDSKFTRALGGSLEWVDMTACPVPLAVDLGSGRTLLGPFEQWLGNAMVLKRVECSLMSNVRTRYIYGFRQSPKPGQRVRFDDEYYADQCVLGADQLKRLQRHVRFLSLRHGG